MENKKNQEQTEVVSGNVAVKAGVWYIACTVVQKSMAFLTMPLFTRIMSKTDIGLFNTYASWITLFVTLTTFDLPLAIIRSKHEFKGDENRYSFSVLALTSTIVILFFCVCMLFKDFLFHNLLDMPDSYVYAMFVYLLLSPAIDIFATQQRAYYKYKTYVVTTLISSVLSLAISMSMVLLLDNKLTGRFMGHYLTMAAVGVIFFVIVAIRGKTIKLEYCKHAFDLCFPLLLHLLSLYLLSSSNKILITKYAGADFTALYSVANSCVNVATMIMYAMNRSWAPWMLDMLEAKQSDKLRAASKPYILGYLALVFFCMLVAPELVLFMGGKSYADSAYLIPPLFAGTVFYFIYQMYLQTEFYEKKTKLVGVATIGAAIVNVGLNVFLIPRFGYSAAAYNTLIGYVVMFVFHFAYACKLGYKNVFDRRFIFAALGASLIAMICSLIMYRITWLRYLTIVLVALIGGYICYKHKDLIIKRINK